MKKQKNKRDQYYIDNKQKIDNYGKEYYNKNKEKINIRFKKNIEKRRIYLKKRYNEKREEILKKRREWSKGRKYCIERYHKDPIHKIKMVLRNRLRAELKYKGITKSFHSHISFLGCTPSECKIYLEKLFLPGMSWDNHGWHIDHILPLSSFDLAKEEEVNKACHYTNLQPLWAVDNLHKSNKIIL